MSRSLAAFRPTVLIFEVIDTKLPQPFGKRHISPLSSEQSTTPTTPTTDSQDIGSLILSPLPRERRGSYKPARLCSTKVCRSTCPNCVIVESWTGWQLGSDPEIQVASPVSNHLTSGILKYFGAAGRYAPAVNFFERMYVREPEVASLLATSYIGMSECSRSVPIPGVFNTNYR
jgi:hypothetical protein